MAALTTDRKRKTRKVDFLLRPLKAGVKAIKGGAAMLITSGGHAGYWAPANTTDTGQVYGTFEETVDNTAGADGAVSANVAFDPEIVLEGFDNDTGVAIAQAGLGSLAYVLDDHTVSGTVPANSNAYGTAFDLTDSGKTVWVIIHQPVTG